VENVEIEKPEEQRRKEYDMTASAIADRIGTLEPSKISDRYSAALALGVVRDGVITGEGPTVNGRVHFSRALDSDDAALCAKILTAAAVEDQPVSRAEAEALFEIDAAAADRSDNGKFDDLFAKAVVHHAAAVSGLPVPSRKVALAPNTAIESWAPSQAATVNTEVLEWISLQMRSNRRSNRTLEQLVAMLVGVASLPLVHAPGMLEFGS
jgi:hypothetical protein